MGTTAGIAIKDHNEYTYIYSIMCGYIDYLGVMLYKYYSNPYKVQGLIELGDVETVGYIIENNFCNSYREHMEIPTLKRGTAAMYRDINRWEDIGGDSPIEWDGVKPRHTTDIEEIYKTDDNPLLWIQYIYIYDLQKRKWYMAYCKDNYIVRDLGDTLHNKALLEELFAEGMNERRKDDLYEACLNAQIEKIMCDHILV